MADKETKPAEAPAQQPAPPPTALPPEADDPRYSEEFRAAKLMQLKAEAEGKKILGSGQPMSLADRLDAIEALVLKWKQKEDEEEAAKAEKEKKAKGEEHGKTAEHHEAKK